MCYSVVSTAKIEPDRGSEGLSLEKSVTNSSLPWVLVFLGKSDILFRVETATDKLTEFLEQK